MALDDVLSRLDKVRKTGPDRWIACCSNHDDKGPSLAIRDMGDGRTLLHCFAGCQVHDVLGAIGLTFDALFPEKVIDGTKRVSRPFPAMDVLRCLETETGVIAVTAYSLRDGVPLTDEDYDRLLVATSRIQAAMGACNV